MKENLALTVNRPAKYRHHRANRGGERRLWIPLVFFLAFSFLFACFYGAGWLIAPFGSSVGIINLDNEDARLSRVLKEASTKDKTVILTTLNEAWAEPGSVIDLFMESFRTGERTIGLLNHLVIVSFDMEAHKRCLKIHKHCFALITEGIDFSEEKIFMTKGYLRMMWRRIDFFRVVLEKGYNFIFSDADIMWFRKPSPYFYPDSDFQISCDHFTGNSTDLTNIPNGGFGYVRSNKKTIQFYKFWYLSRLKYPGYHDQDVLNFIKHDTLISEIGLEIRFLSTVYFGGICEPSRDFGKVCTMHANCCLGLKSKLNDLRVIVEDWRIYVSLPPRLKSFSIYSWRVPQNCSLDLVNRQRDTFDRMS